MDNVMCNKLDVHFTAKKPRVHIYTYIYTIEIEIIKDLKIAIGIEKATK